MSAENVNELGIVQNLIVSERPPILYAMPARKSLIGDIGRRCRIGGGIHEARSFKIGVAIFDARKNAVADGIVDT